MSTDAIGIDARYDASDISTPARANAAERRRPTRSFSLPACDGVAGSGGHLQCDPVARRQLGVRWSSRSNGQSQGRGSGRRRGLFELAGVHPIVARKTSSGNIVSTDPDRLNLGFIHAFLATSYWSRGVPRITVERAAPAHFATADRSTTPESPPSCHPHAGRSRQCRQTTDPCSNQEPQARSHEVRPERRSAAPAPAETPQHE
jgi:hypothetical protein